MMKILPARSYFPLLLLLLLACKKAPSEGPEVLANQALESIERGDWEAVSKMVHPEWGVRFSPYAYIDTVAHRRFSPEELIQLPNDLTPRLWGNYDGTGDPIEVTFEEYAKEFIYDRDYATIQQTPRNQLSCGGNSLNNITEIYGNDVAFFEYCIPGSEESGGMDWSVLRFVFKEEGGRWYIVSVVHDEWTI